MKRVKGDTIARTICLLIAIINQVLAVTGKDILPFVDDEIYQVCSLIATMVTSLIAWWKNNSFTAPAINADEIMKKDKLAAKNFKG